MSLHVVGLDLSLTATGVADDNGTRTIGSKLKGMERLAELRDQIRDRFYKTYLFGPDLVVIEGYSMGPQRGSQGIAQALGELGGVVKLALWEAGILYVDVSPSSLKKYATGKGNASKAEVLTAAVRRLGYEGSNDNEADASWLYTMARDWYIGLKGIVPLTHRAALVKVPWPEIVQDESLAGSMP